MMQGWLAAWLFWGGIPLGALTLVLGSDLIGGEAPEPLNRVLRVMVLLAPLAALLLIPIAASPASLFASAPTHFAQIWMTGSALALRFIVYAVAWTVMALLVARKPRARRRRGLPGILLALHVTLITFATADLVTATDPRQASPVFALLLITMQTVVALAVALLVSASAARARMAVSAATALTVLACVWLFLLFIPYLVTWMANRPGDAAWYLARESGSGRALAWFGTLAGFVLPLIILTRPRLLAIRLVVRGAAILVLAAQAITVLWLIGSVGRAEGLIAFVAAGIVMLVACFLLIRRAVPQRIASHAG